MLSFINIFPDAMQAASDARQLMLQRFVFRRGVVAVFEDLRSCWHTSDAEQQHIVSPVFVSIFEYGSHKFYQWPNNAPEPTPIVHRSSACAVVRL